MHSLTCEQVRQVDRRAIEQLGIPGVVLMENAGANAAQVILKRIRRRLKLAVDKTRVAILCGGGNNGGDGYVIARHLAIAGAAVEIYATTDPQTLHGDAAINATIVSNMNLPVHAVWDVHQLDTEASAWDTAHVLVDALLGTGFKGPVRDDLLAVINRINSCRARMVVAVDIPSGLEGDSGHVQQAAVRADVTVTFVAAKRGFVEAKATPFLGCLVVVGIGVPDWFVDSVEALA